MIDPLLQSDEAETAVLGAMLMDPEAIVRAAEVVDASMFARPALGRLFGAMLYLAETGTAVDPLTLATELDRRGQLEAVGGRAAIAELIDAVPTAANVQYHAKIVRELAERRRIAAACERLREAATDRTIDVQALAQETLEALLPLATEGQEGAGFRRAEFWRVTQAIEERAKADVPGLPTGYPELDDVTRGFRPGELVIVGGVAKGGKTALALECARYALLERQARVGFVSAEMDADSLMERMLNAEAVVPVHATASGRLASDDYPRVARAAGMLSAAELYIDDAALPTLDDIRARAVALVAEHGPVDLLVVDFLQLVRHQLKGRRGDEELTAISYGLKGLAKRLHCVVLAPCQLNYKDVERRTSPRPTFADLAGSSGMMQAADVVILTHREAMYNAAADDTMELTVRGRRIPDFTARLRWDGRHMRILSSRKHPAPDHWQGAA